MSLTSSLVTVTILATLILVGKIQAKAKLWKDGGRCGPGNLLDDGVTPAQCNPTGVYPCCSPNGWCGNTNAHCNCAGCVDYSGRYGEGPCLTDYEEKPCVFPFIYGGKTFNGCTKDGHDDWWCSVKTDGNGNYQSGQWGNCNSACPEHLLSLVSPKLQQVRLSGCLTDYEEKPCVFPFIYGGKTFNGCTKDGHD